MSTQKTLKINVNAVYSELTQLIETCNTIYSNGLSNLSFQVITGLKIEELERLREIIQNNRNARKMDLTNTFDINVFKPIHKYIINSLVVLVCIDEQIRGIIEIMNQF